MKVVVKLDDGPAVTASVGPGGSFWELVRLMQWRHFDKTFGFDADDGWREFRVGSVERVTVTP